MLIFATSHSFIGTMPLRYGRKCSNFEDKVKNTPPISVTYSQSGDCVPCELCNDVAWPMKHGFIEPN